MSPRAAWRLEGLGFDRVYDYVPGKVDWMAAGLPMEGDKADRLRAGHALRADPPTCLPREPVADALERMGTAWDLCVVVNEQRVVLGRVRRDDVEPGSPALCGEVMEVGPTTTRPSIRLEKIAERLDGSRIDHVLVTDPGGVLLGVLFHADARALLDGEGAA